MFFIQTVYFFFDDSGVLHANERSGYFVYGGYVFLSRSDLDIAKRKYINANKKIKAATGFTGELKAAVISNDQKRSLYNVVRDYESVSCSVEIKRVYASILSSKKSICRYKDYVLKRCVKSKLIDFIHDGKLNPQEEITIHIFIDEQLTATNGYYDLRDSIKEELQHGIKNFDYGTFHKNIFDSEVTVNISYCESKHNYLIQASDILANKVWHLFLDGNSEKIYKIPNHRHLTFP